MPKTPSAPTNTPAHLLDELFSDTVDEEQRRVWKSKLAEEFVLDASTMALLQPTDWQQLGIPMGIRVRLCHAAMAQSPASLEPGGR